MIMLNGRKPCKFLENLIGKKFINNIPLFECWFPDLPVGSQVAIVGYEHRGVLPEVWIKYNRWVIIFLADNKEKYFYYHKNKEKFTQDFTLVG